MVAIRLCASLFPSPSKLLIILRLSISSANPQWIAMVKEKRALNVTQASMKYDELDAITRY